MADFDDNENLVETGDVCLTVSVIMGPQSWHYCSSDVPLTDEDGVAYEPVPVMTTNIKADGSMGTGELEVELPRNVSLSDVFFPVAAPGVPKIIVRQAHYDEGVIQEAPLAFTGVVTTASSTSNSAVLKLKCSTQQGLLSRSGLRRRYQIQCPFLLFGSECRAIKSDAQFQANIGPGTFSDISIWIYGEDADQPLVWRGRDLKVNANRIFMIGATITFQGVDYRVSDLSDRDNTDDSKNQFRLRMMEPEKTQLLDAVLATPVEARTCVVTPACDHTTSSCAEIFRNGNNFGGMPWIPFQNPTKMMFVGQ